MSYTSDQDDACGAPRGTTHELAELVQDRLGVLIAILAGSLASFFLVENDYIDQPVQITAGDVVLQLTAIFLPLGHLASGRSGP